MTRRARSIAKLRLAAGSRFLPAAALLLLAPACGVPAAARHTSDGSPAGAPETDAGGGGAAGGGAPGAGGTGGSGGGGAAGDVDGGVALPLARDIAIAEVALLQGVKVSLARDGARNDTRPAPVIAERDGLWRVFVRPGDGWTPRAITAELRLGPEGGERVYTASQTIAAASSDGALDSTFNFDLPGEALSVGARFAVSLHAAADQPPGGDDGQARYPTDGGFDTVDAQDAGDPLKIVLVPIRYGADGSSRLPDTGATQVDLYRRTMLAYYPTRSVEISVREPTDWPSALARDGSGWNQLLQAMVRLRQQDHAPKDVYYFAAFEPAGSFGAFCGTSCVLGLCGLASSPSDSVSRACVGVGFSGATAAGTMAHEIGHAHGRQHAPCGGAANPDLNYPYAGAKLGSWGWDITAKALKDPDKYTDLMGYCRPQWISDFNFGKIFERIEFVSRASIATGGRPQAFRFVDVAADGHMTWGDRFEPQDAPLSEPTTLSWRGADGVSLGTATGHYYPYSDLPGGFLLVPDDGPGEAVAITIDGVPGRFAGTTLRRSGR